MTENSQKLSEVAKFLDSLKKRRKIVPMTPTTEEQRVNMDGFRVVLVGLEPEFQKELDLFREALKEYKKKASQRLPVLLKKQLPLVLRFDREPSIGGTLGNYGENYIEILPRNAYRLNMMLEALAHEMGHHLYHTLSSQDTTFWRGALKGDIESVDLRKLLKEWPAGSSLYGWMERERDKDPILALQLEALMTPTNPKVPFKLREKWKTMDDREGVEVYLAEGGDPFIEMPRTPISGYATTNPEEAFSEVVARLVVYGERAVHPKVLSWFRMIV